MVRSSARPSKETPTLQDRWSSTKPTRLRLLAMALISLATSCQFGAPAGFRLGVPYVQQGQPNYCTAASVLMWRLYLGRTGITQVDIFNWEGPGCTTIVRVVQAVVYFTGIDAYWDNDTDPNYYKLVSRQIASVSNGQPVIPV